MKTRPTDIAINARPCGAASTAGDAAAATDYALVQAVIRFVSDHHTAQPTLAAIADAVGVTPRQCQRTFKRWCGLSPKEFLATLTLDHAQRMLAQSATVLEAADQTGLSGAGRLHDLFVSYHAVTPGQFKSRGAGLELAYGLHMTPFGMAMFAVTPHGLAALTFLASDDASADANVNTRFEEAEPDLASDDQIKRGAMELQRRWPAATLHYDPAQTAPYVARAFPHLPTCAPQPLRIVMIGSDFEVRVWHTLLKVAPGHAASYRDIAAHIDQPKAARAVGAAVGRNPISFVVPCHRILRADGGLGGYHWGLTRKRAIIGWEAGRGG